MNKIWIKAEEYKAFIPSEYDKPIHVNHENCPAGEDTRGRLYITRKRDGIVAYCHNCGGRGFIKNGIRTIQEHKEYLEQKDIKDGIHYSYAPSFDECDERYRDGKPIVDSGAPIWYRKKHQVKNRGALSKVRIIETDANWVYSITILTTENDILGYERRADHRDGTKVVQYIAKNCKHAIEYVEYKKKPTHNTVIIVEDLQSYYAIANTVFVHHIDCNVICLLGTHISDSLAVHLANNYDRVILWLDPDPAGIKATQKHNSTLSMLGLDIRSIHSLNDPKYYNGTDIIEFIKQTLGD